MQFRGRFSLRNNLTKCHITDSPAEYRRFLEDPSLDVNRADELNTEIIMLTYDVIDEFIEENMSSNVMVSLWTTAAARIKLLKELQKIVAAGGKILYTDTGKFFEENFILLRTRIYFCRFHHICVQRGQRLPIVNRLAPGRPS